jgi:hypothetical protein
MRSALERYRERLGGPILCGLTYAFALARGARATVH